MLGNPFLRLALKIEMIPNEYEVYTNCRFSWIWKRVSITPQNKIVGICMNVCLWYLILGYFGTFGVHWGKSCVLLHSLGYFGVPYGQGSLNGLNKCLNLNPTIHPANDQAINEKISQSVIKTSGCVSKLNIMVDYKQNLQFIMYIWTFRLLHYYFIYNGRLDI